MKTQKRHVEIKWPAPGKHNGPFEMIAKAGVNVADGGIRGKTPAPQKGGDMGDTPFIKFYPSDFLAGTSGLSPAERGVYITILCLIYEADGGIARDDARLSRRCGMPKAAFKRTIEALIDEGKLTCREGVLSNKRAEKAIVDRQSRTQNATHAAHKKWEAQRQKDQQNQGGKDACAMPPQCVGDASQNQSQNQKPEKEYISFNEDEFFDEFWSLVPKRVGKGSARSALSDALKKAPPDVILAGIRAYAEEREGEDHQFTASPASWLTGERWLDEPSPGAPTQVNSDASDNMHAQAIKEGKSYLLSWVSASTIRRLIDKQLVTEAECLAAGVAY